MARDSRHNVSQVPGTFFHFFLIILTNILIYTELWMGMARRHGRDMGKKGLRQVVMCLEPM